MIPFICQLFFLWPTDSPVLFTCPMCTDWFTSNQGLQEHIMETHEKDEDQEEEEIIRAPKVISKKASQSSTDGRPWFFPPEAPHIITKSTSGRRVRREPISSLPPDLEEEDQEEEHAREFSQMVPNDKPVAESEIDAPEEMRESCVETMPTGDVIGVRQPDDPYTNPQPSTSKVTPVAEPGLIHEPSHGFIDLDIPFECPEPFPQPFQGGLVVNRGEWVTPERAAKLRHRRERHGPTSDKGLRRYHYKPGITISGKSRVSTFEAHEKEEVGNFHCPEPGCQARFTMKRSLDAHSRRLHNKKLTFQCPYPSCGKWLSSHQALPKHLLSHCPREQWPYKCPLCHRRFQAKGDLPKHLDTNQHKKDRHRIPPHGSKAWKNLMNSSLCTNEYRMMIDRARRYMRNAAQPEQSQIQEQQRPVIQEQWVVVDNEDEDEDGEEEDASAATTGHSYITRKAAASAAQALVCPPTYKEANNDLDEDHEENSNLNDGPSWPE